MRFFKSSEKENKFSVRPKPSTKTDKKSTKEELKKIHVAEVQQVVQGTRNPEQSLAEAQALFTKRLPFPQESGYPLVMTAIAELLVRYEKNEAFLQQARVWLKDNQVSFEKLISLNTHIFALFLNSTIIRGHDLNDLDFQKSADKLFFPNGQYSKSRFTEYLKEVKDGKVAPQKTLHSLFNTNHGTIKNPEITENFATLVQADLAKEQSLAENASRKNELENATKLNTPAAPKPLAQQNREQLPQWRAPRR